MEVELSSSHRLKIQKSNGSDEPALKAIVREIGLKVTQQRLAILRILLGDGAHFTAQSIYDAIVETNPEVGFATVYRFLKTLTEKGYVTEMRIGGLPARYEWAKKEHHDHLTCLKCGIIREFENAEIEELQVKIAQSFGFQLTDHVLELYGNCPACADSN